MDSIGEVAVLVITVHLASPSATAVDGASRAVRHLSSLILVVIRVVVAAPTKITRFDCARILQTLLENRRLEVVLSSKFLEPDDAVVRHTFVEEDDAG